MKAFEVEKIEVRKPRHTVSFSKDELIEILKNHMRAQGASVPEGSTYVSGLDYRHYDRPQEITLVIDPN